MQLFQLKSRRRGRIILYREIYSEMAFLFLPTRPPKQVKICLASQLGIRKARGVAREKATNT